VNISISVANTRAWRMREARIALGRFGWAMRIAGVLPLLVWAVVDRSAVLGPVFAVVLLPSVELIGWGSYLTNRRFGPVCTYTLTEGFLLLPKQSFTPEQAAEWRAFLVARGAVAA
jgi:hypothetical protein